MSIRARVWAVVVCGACAGCAVPSWYGSGGDFERPPPAAPPSSAGTEVASGDPAPPPPPSTAPAGDGWDPAPPAGSVPARDPLADPNAYPPPPPPPASGATPEAQPSGTQAPGAQPSATAPTTPPPLAPGAQAAGASDSDPLYYSFLGKEPPELAANGTWLTPATAPSLAALRGQVVLVMFAFQGCPSCALMTPYLQQWHQMYGPQGLAVVYVNNGLMADEQAARKAITTDSLAFPYFHDAKGETLRLYGIRSFPTAYLIDRQGKVVWEGTPLAIEAQVQAKIADLLK